ncbi:MAG TPA: hypothetical protein VII20_16990 [Roseiarcus sp.]|jgi:hypothetical protein
MVADKTLKMSPADVASKFSTGVPFIGAALRRPATVSVTPTRAIPVKAAPAIL